MNKRRVKEAVLLMCLVGLVVIGACKMWLLSYRRQEALNRQLIVALRKGDPKQALTLVNAGADPNTPVIPLPPPSLTDLWNHLIHRTALPDNDTPSAFLLSCGAYRLHHISGNAVGLLTDEPHLVEIMLQHGAQKDAKDSDGWTSIHKMTRVTLFSFWSS